MVFFDGLWLEPVMCDVSHIFLYGMYTCIPGSITMEVKTHFNTLIEEMFHSPRTEEITCGKTFPQ